MCDEVAPVKVLLCYACEQGCPDDCSGWCGVAVSNEEFYGPIDWRGFEDMLDILSEYDEQ
jgi:hypothetical protein